jgi:hypothetical protein
MQRIAFATLVVVALFCARPSPAAADESANVPPPWLAEAMSAWDAKDSAAAFALLETGQAPADAGKRYAALALHAYRQERDVARTTVAALAGIRFCLDRAGQVAATDATAASTLRGIAKSIAYDLGANLWPGWMDEGVTLGPSDVAIGLDAARLNLRLGVELGRPAEPIGNAHWLLGAHLLAAKDHDRAVEQFSAASAKFKEAAKPAAERMAEAYGALAERLRAPSDAGRKDALAKRLAALEAVGGDDAKFFAEQVRTADRAFLK